MGYKEQSVVIAVLGLIQGTVSPCCCVGLNVRTFMDCTK